MGSLSDILAHSRMGMTLQMLTTFLFALTLVSNPFSWASLEVLLILHFFLYPSISLYNDYCDKDEGPVGCLEKPPPVTESLFWAALFLDATAFTWAYVRLPPSFALFCIFYAVSHRLYSHPVPRIKKRPMTALVFWNGVEGYFTVVATVMAITGASASLQVHVAGLVFTLFLMSSWPIYQVYQHDQDRKNGETTLSMLLGVKGSLAFAFVFMGIGGLAQIGYFYAFLEKPFALTVAFMLTSLPVLVTFFSWWNEVCKDKKNADYKRSMKFLWVMTTTAQVFYTGMIINTLLNNYYKV